MLFPNVTYLPADFAEKILIDAVNLSPKTKAFLKEKAIKNVLQFSNISPEIISSTRCMHIKREIGDFLRLVITWMKKEIKNVQFTHNFPPPQKKLSGKEKPILIALLLGEPLFGNRKNMSIAKKIHLPELYKENFYRNRKCTFSRPMRKFNHAA